MESKLVCTSCKKRITNDSGTIIIKCPNCEKADIIRCQHCRQIAVKYKCKNCGFEGPN